MMSFFPTSFSAPAPAAEVSYAPLFPLLENYDNYSRETKAAPSAPCAPATRRQRTRQARPQPATFQPAFDVRETENTYELYGELPGLERQNVSIEFTDAQSMVISGRVGRNYDSHANNDTNESAISDEASSTEEFTEIEKPRRNSYKVTVEDDPEDEHNTPATTPATSPKMEAAKPQTQEVAKAEQKTQPAHNEPRYHLLERSIGEFSRVFTFPARVDYDGVTASLNNGVLAVVVPKARPVNKRIEIAA